MLVQHYRSYAYQVGLFNKGAASYGEEYADRYWTRPGYSEHQYYLSYLDFSLHFMMNEFYLILIGAIIAFLLNLVHDYSGEEEYLNSCMIYMEDKIQSLMYQIVHYIQSEERNTTIWKELEDIKEQG